MATIDVVIPTYRGIHPEGMSNLMAMVREANCQCRTHAPWKCNKGKHSVRLNPYQRGSSVVHWARNQTIAMAMYGMEKSPDGRPEPDYFFLMDDDMLCQPGHLERLVGYKSDIVCGIATVRRDPPRPNIRFWNPAKETFFEPIEWDWDSNKLIEIDAAGAAYMLVKRKVLDRMAKAYRECEFERAEDQRKFPRCDETDAYWDKKSEARKKRFAEALAPGGDWKKADCWWFQFLDNVVDSQTAHELGEDISFCWKAKKLGFKIFADPQVLPGHIGDYGYSILDYRDYVDAEKAMGRIPEFSPNQVALSANQEAHALDSHSHS